MTPSNAITLSGQLTEYPRKAEGATVFFVLEHRHAWRDTDGRPQTGAFALDCVAWGHAARSVLKYHRPGVEVCVHGRLCRFGGSVGVGVLVDSLTYVSPSKASKGCPDED